MYWGTDLRGEYRIVRTYGERHNSITGREQVKLETGRWVDKVPSYALIHFPQFTLADIRRAPATWVASGLIKLIAGDLDAPGGLTN
jgi:hypothetical protein